MISANCKDEDMNVGDLKALLGDDDSREVIVWDDAYQEYCIPEVVKDDTDEIIIQAGDAA